MATTLEAEHLFTITAYTGDRKVIQNGPAGTRVIVPVTGGTFEGEKLKGTVAEAPGGDWVTARPDGSVKLDVRLLLQTDDGAAILMTYLGIGVPGDDGLKIRSAPTFETGDEQYAWLNHVQAVGIGAPGEGSVRYEVYRLL